MQLLFLRTLKIPALIWKRLGELPASLREAYNDTYEINLESYVEDERSITKSAFKLLLSLHKPLEHRDFLHALSFCNDDRITLSTEELLDLCFGFLVFDSGQNVFRFAHLSVREFLETKPDYSPESSHALAAQFCLRYLCTSNDSGPYLIPRDTSPDSGVAPSDMGVSATGLEYDGRVMSWKISPSAINEDPFLFNGSFNEDPFGQVPSNGDPFLDQVQEYACLYWVDHTAGSRHFRLAQPLNTMLRDFVMDASQVVSPWFMYWNSLVIHCSWHTQICQGFPSRQIKTINDMAHIPADYLFTAIIWAFNDLLELRLRSRPDSLLLRSRGDSLSALQLACLYGNRDTVKVLLDWDWSLQVDDNQTLLALAMKGLRESRLWSSSGLAVDDKYIETMKFLLSCGVDPNMNMRLYDRTHDFVELDFPILSAIDTGSTELVKVFLDHGANADAEDYNGLKAFHVAAVKGELEIAGLLLAARTNVDDFARTFLKHVDLIHQALEEMDKRMLTTALRKWPRDARGNTYLDYALYRAVEQYIYDCVKPLLVTGANPNATFGGESIIDCAIGRIRMLLFNKEHFLLQLLLDHGAVPTEQSSKKNLKSLGFHSDSW